MGKSGSKGKSKAEKKAEKKAKKVARRRDRRRATHMGAILGRQRRSGRWLVSRHLGVVVVIGGCQLDLRDADFESAKMRFSVTTILGTTEVIVPPGTLVRASGISLLALSDVKVPKPTTDQRAINLDWTAVLGKVSVRLG